MDHIYHQIAENSATVRQLFNLFLSYLPVFVEAVSDALLDCLDCGSPYRNKRGEV